MVVIKHRGDSVETETVETEFLKPVLAVGEQEMEHGVLAIVEQQGVPRGMLAASVAIEVEVVAAVKTSQSLHFIFHGVGVYDIHDHGYAETMRLVYESLKIIGRTESGAGGIEAAYVIAERTIVGMLLNGHDLDGIIAIGRYARKSLLAELVVGAHTFLLLGHSYVALIYKERLGVGREFAHLEFIGIFRGIDLGGEYLGVGVLHNSVGIRGDTFSLATVPGNKHLEEIAVVEGIFRKRQFPHSVLRAVEFVFIGGLPSGECTDEPYLAGIGCILPEHPSPLRKMVQTIEFICVGEVGERTAGVRRELIKFSDHILMTALDSRLERLEPGVIAENR